MATNDSGSCEEIAERHLREIVANDALDGFFQKWNEFFLGTEIFQSKKCGQDIFTLIVSGAICRFDQSKNDTKARVFSEK